MATSDLISAGGQKQPKTKVIDNPPASGVAKALANSKAQVNKAK